MAPTLFATTPSPPGSVRTPGTPKHGYSDSWEPYHSPRKSARISAKQDSSTNANRNRNCTPSPRSSHQSSRSPTKSAFSTPAASPIKKRLPKMDSVRRASGNLTSHGTANAATSLGINSAKSQPKSSSASRAAGDLLTPAKTPHKQPNTTTEAASRAMARRLFAPEDDMMPTPRKRAKVYSGLTLDSFRAEDVEEEIEIFTDTRDHLPQVDATTDNPFYGDRVIAEPSKRRSKRKAVIVPGEGRHTVEDTVKRDDGVLVVFRGKKIFRKFSDGIDADLDSQEEDEISELEQHSQATPRRRPMTRSSIKPRLLFPPKAKGKEVAAGTIEDEEADTDIEDHVLHPDAEDVEPEMPATPVQPTKGKVETPEAPRFAPASPPSTGRATRSSDKLRTNDTPMKAARVSSPFDGWRRSKRHAAPQGSKREGDFLAQPPSSKRQRA